jgi:hypothetical protein
LNIEGDICDYGKEKSLRLSSTHLLLHKQEIATYGWLHCKKTAFSVNLDCHSPARAVLLLQEKEVTGEKL